MGVADGLIRVSVGIEGTDDPVVDGAIGGAVFAWLYNRLLGKRGGLTGRRSPVAWPQNPHATLRRSCRGSMGLK